MGRRPRTAGPLIRSPPVRSRDLVRASCSRRLVRVFVGAKLVAKLEPGLARFGEHPDKEAKLDAVGARPATRDLDVGGGQIMLDAADPDLHGDERRKRDGHAGAI